MQKAKSIMSCRNHILAQNFELLPSGKRLRETLYRLKRTKNFFYTTSDIHVDLKLDNIARIIKVLSLRWPFYILLCDNILQSSLIFI